MKAEVRGYVELLPVFDREGNCIGAKFGPLTVNPKRTSAPVVELLFDVDLAMFEPITIPVSGSISRPSRVANLAVDPNSMYGEALAKVLGEAEPEE